jgi:galactokinase
MAESHLSTKNDFQITCKEVDEMVDIARRQNGAIGSRMTGGGFGGCTVNLVNTEAAKDFKRTVSEEYRRFTQIDVEIYEVKAGAGVTEVAVHGLDE